MLEFDQLMMDAAIDLAVRGRGAVEPNPMVGCVIVRDGEIIGQGYHERFGGPHAEVNAMQSIEPSQVNGATAYVTLEPCCHQGKTPPCATALITAGIGRVVVGVKDPFAEVNGGGIAMLAAAGIQVDVGVRETECRNLIAAFEKLIRTQTPYVRAKWAMTMDGRIATRSGNSQWITGSAARSDVHRTRSLSDAILVGMGTVRADDPMLTARPDELAGTANRKLHRMVLCHRSVPSVDSRLVRSANQFPLILVMGSGIASDLSAPLASAGAVILAVDSDQKSEIVSAALRYAGSNRWTNLLVEGGGQVLGEFFDGDHVDACDIYIGGKCFGGATAHGPIAGRGVATVIEAKGFDLIDLVRFGNDVKLEYRRHGQKQSLRENGPL